jgi:hypothetical protein
VPVEGRAVHTCLLTEVNNTHSAEAISFDESDKGISEFCASPRMPRIFSHDNSPVHSSTGPKLLLAAPPVTIVKHNMVIFRDHQPRKNTLIPENHHVASSPAFVCGEEAG